MEGGTWRVEPSHEQLDSPHVPETVNETPSYVKNSKNVVWLCVPTSTASPRPPHRPSSSSQRTRRSSLTRKRSALLPRPPRRPQGTQKPTPAPIHWGLHDPSKVLARKVMRCEFFNVNQLHSTGKFNDYSLLINVWLFF